MCYVSVAQVFEEAVSKLGLEKAVPKTITQVRWGPLPNWY
jgi:hypothetical protein